MARRFLLHQEQADFRVSVQGNPLPRSYDVAGFEYQFPKDLPEPIEGVTVDNQGWGTETVAGEEIRWRFLFQKNTIDEEELKGIAVFAGGKLAQRPFLFDSTRGTTGQHGAEYLAGQVVADFIDRSPTDLIATERQRVNWDREETAPLLTWGQRRLLREHGMYALDWGTLLDKALAAWHDFLDILEERGEGDLRMEQHFKAVREQEGSEGLEGSAELSEAGAAS